jgi:hypothetical protein
MFRNSPNLLEEMILRPNSIEYSSAQFKEHLDGCSVYCPVHCASIKHISSKTANGSLPRLTPHKQSNLASSIDTYRSDVRISSHPAVTPSCGNTRKDKSSYQLHRYLSEPAGYQARLINGDNPGKYYMDMLDFSTRKEVRSKETRRTAMRRKIRAMERKIGEL